MQLKPHCTHTHQTPGCLQRSELNEDKRLWQNLRTRSHQLSAASRDFSNHADGIWPLHFILCQSASPLLDASSLLFFLIFPLVFLFGRAQSGVVSQPGSPHRREIKSAGKKPGEMCLFSDIIVEKGVVGMKMGMGRGEMALGLFCALSEPFPGCRERCVGSSPPAGGKGGCVGKIPAPRWVFWCPKVPGFRGWGCFGVGCCCSCVGFLWVVLVCGGVGGCGCHSRATHGC